LTAHSLLNYWYDPAYAKSPDWPGFVREITKERLSGDVLIQNYPDPALPYYLRDSVPSFLVPGKSSAQMPNVANRMEELAAKYGRIWFQPVAGNVWDPEGFAATWLDRHARFVHAYSFRGLQLELFMPASSAITASRTNSTLFANNIRLIGFDLNLADDTGSGKSAEVLLYWEALDRVQRDATVFVHLYDGKGNLMAQEDGEPVHGSYPTHDWSKGEIVVDSHDLQLPTLIPPGQYSVAVGMYDAETKERVLILESDGLTLPDNRAMLASLSLK
jgi:hypothetical protein